MVFYKPLLVLGVPGALGFSIVLLTVFIRLILYPLNLKQLRSAQEMQKLKPKIDILAKKHKNNKKKLQQEQLKLYQKHGINPAAGCLPTLLQFPILIGLYRVFLQLLGNGHMDGITEQINKIVYIPQLKITQFNVDFFGISLGVNPSQWQKYGIWLLAIPLITAGLSYYQARTMQPKEANSQDKKKEKKGEEDFAGAMQTQMKYLFPLMIGWISFRFPLGLTLYWNTFSLFGIIQQLQVKKEVRK
jgi:YidC/Oxa1 family membrane protein insertase